MKGTAMIHPITILIMIDRGGCRIFPRGGLRFPPDSEWLSWGRGLRQRFSINLFQGPIFVLFSMGGPFDGIVICVLREGYKQARIKCFVVRGKIWLKILPRSPEMALPMP